MFVDELIVSFDFGNVMCVMEVLCIINIEDGIIVIVNLYMFDMVCVYCDCIVVMCFGFVMFDGSVCNFIDEVVCDIYGSFGFIEFNEFIILIFIWLVVLV